MIDINKKEIGKRLKICRLAKNITQEVLSEKIGIQTQSYSNIESGTRLFSVEVLIKLMHELEVSADYILTGQTNNNSSIDVMLNNMSQENLIRAQLIIKLFSEGVNN